MTDQGLIDLEESYWDFRDDKLVEVEDFFYEYFSENKELLGIKFDHIEKKITYEGGEDYIILVNNKISALILIEYKLTKNDVDNFINNILKKFKYFLSNIGSIHKLYGGMATFILDDEVKEYAKSKGLYIFGRKGKDVETHFDNDFIGKEF